MPGFYLPKEGGIKEIHCQMACDAADSAPLLSRTIIAVAEYNELIALKKAIKAHEESRVVDRDFRVAKRQHSHAVQSLPSLQAYLVKDPEEEDVVVSLG